MSASVIEGVAWLSSSRRARNVHQPDRAAIANVGCAGLNKDEYPRNARAYLPSVPVACNRYRGARQRALVLGWTRVVTGSGAKRVMVRTCRR